MPFQDLILLFFSEECSRHSFKTWFAGQMVVFICGGIRSVYSAPVHRCHYVCDLL